MSIEGIFQRTQNAEAGTLGLQEYFLESALSLKTGEYIEAQKLVSSSAYRASLKQFLVCPECGEPVHYRKRESPYNTPFFAHYKQGESMKAILACSLRAEGASFKLASQVVAGIKHGQFVDRFQRDFCSSLHDSFGRYSEALYSFISNIERDPLIGGSYVSFVGQIEKRADFWSVARGDIENEEAWLAEGVEDVCRFLRSRYGEWVGHFIQHVATFVAVTLHPDVQEADVGRYRFEIGGRDVVFVAEPFRIKNSQDGRLRQSARVRRLLPQVAAVLVAHLVLKWRAPKKVVSLFGAAESIDNEIGGSTPTGKPRVASGQYNKALVAAQRSSRRTSENSVGSEPPPNRQPKSWPWPITPAPTQPPPPLRSPSAPRTVWAPSQSSQVRRAYDSDLLRHIRESNEANVRKANPEHRAQAMANVAGITNIHQSSTRSQASSRPIGSSFAAPPAVQARSYSATPHMISSDAKSRVYDLVLYSKRLARPVGGSLVDREAVLKWSGKANPIEAYFLASFLGIPHDPPDFSDPTLTQRLAAWIQFAELYG